VTGQAAQQQATARAQHARAGRKATENYSEASKSRNSLD